MSPRVLSPRQFVILSLCVIVGLSASVLATVYARSPDASTRNACAAGTCVGALSALIVLAIALAMLRGARRHAQQAEAQIDLLLETLPVTIAIIDSTMRIKYVNRSLEKMFGYVRTEVTGHSLEKLVPERVRELFGDRAIAADVKPITAIDPLRHRFGVRRDGKRIPLEVRFRALERSGKRLLLCVIRDATELHQAERSLRRAEEKYRAIFENAGEGIYQVTPEGRFLTANPAMARMLGYDSATELMAKVTDVKKQVFVEPSQRSMIRMLSEQAGRARGFEYQAYRKDGSKIWVMGNQRVVRNARGQVVYYEGNIEEITERKKAEDGLRESQRALLTLMSNLPGMAYRGRNDRVRTMEFVSEGAFELTKRAPADFGPHGALAFGKLIHPEDSDRVWNEVQTALRSDQPFQIQYRINVADGYKTVWEQGRGVRGFNDGGRFLLEGLIIDVDERVRAQEGLRQSEERFRQLAENIHGVFWMTNPEMTEVFYVNNAYERIWCRTKNSLYKEPQSRLEAIDTQDRARVLAVCSRAVHDGYDEEYRIQTPSGETRWIWDRAFPIADEKGKVYRLAGIAEDITERKRLEEQFRQAQKMEAIGRLAGGIAHDFNNLLCIINGYSDLLLLALPAGGESFEHCQRISQAGERAAGLTRQLLAFSRKTLLIPKVLDLNLLLSGMQGMVERLIGEDVRCTFDLDPALGKVRADPGQLDQVVMNLVVNARDAMPNGGTLQMKTRNVTLDESFTRERENLKPGEYVLLEVRDTGCGMDDSQQAHIFEPFFTTKPVGKGTGLGLAQVYGVVKQSNGDIVVVSTPGQGAAFDIYLPRVAEEPTAAAIVQATDNGPEPAERGRETILLVEDEDMVREMARNLLLKSGYTVLEASQGRQALEVADKYDGPIHLLVSDVVMPIMNGPELQRQLAPRRPEMKIMFTTGYTDSALMRYGISETHKQVLLKPFAPNDLLKTVREVLDE